MARVREAQFQDLRARHRSGLLRGFLFIHLKKDLEVDPVDWKGCPDPSDASEDARPPQRRGRLTSYGLRKDMQERLAALRTDLDSFNDAEAYALMTSGYRMIEREFADSGLNIHHLSAKPQPWVFLEAEKLMNLSTGYEDGGSGLLAILGVGSQNALKAWRLSRPLRIGTLAALSIILAVILGFCLRQPLEIIVVQRRDWKDIMVLVQEKYLLLREVPLFKLAWVDMALAGVIVAAVFGRTCAHIFSFWRSRVTSSLNLLGNSEIRKIIVGLAMSLVGFLFARIYLRFFDPIFLKAGKLENLSKRARESSGPN
jgi:hypothetical protein